MLRTRSVVRGVVALAAIAVVALAVPPLSLALDESAMPPASSLPALPEGARVTGEDMGCASGGCWRELTVDAPPGMSDEQLKAEVLPDGYECAFQGVLDLRRVCAGVIEAESKSVQFFVQYERWVH
ncbi:hypothetical protein ACQEVI_05130 [Promicromonospora sp. CA-289599]|uniref:hypothetical protein n=1 Tax=Promicromonospora sp. CA-289599 TaxID=3240014 RepID=UPI003D8E8736